MLAPYRAYFEEFGFWPKPKQLQAAIESGFAEELEQEQVAD